MSHHFPTSKLALNFKQRQYDLHMFIIFYMNSLTGRFNVIVFFYYLYGRERSITPPQDVRCKGQLSTY